MRRQRQEIATSNTDYLNFVGRMAVVVGGSFGIGRELALGLTEAGVDSAIAGAARSKTGSGEIKTGSEHE